MTRVMSVPTIAVSILLALCGLASAAPFSEQIAFRQPDGTQILIHGEGDEFHAVFETLDGYTVVFDQALQAYCYARLTADNSDLTSAGELVGRADPATLALAPHLRMPSDTMRKKAHDRFLRWDAATGVSAQWEATKATRRALDAAATKDGPALAPPSSTTMGTKVGLTLLIDFDDDPATITQSDIDSFCNAGGYTGYGNNGSVRQYFLDNSNNQLDYTNVVTIYIRIPNSLHPKSWYNDTSKDCGTQGNLLIRDAIAIMTNRPDYASTILPTFSSLSVDGGNNVIAFNVFYAGGNGGVWSYGLWPHSFSLCIVGAQSLEAGGKKIFRYQVTNIGGTLGLGTFCHENGHMLCDFPDIYDYNYDSKGGAGVFCLMNNGGNGGNPVQVCAYLKRAAGWATTIDLDASSLLTASVSASGADFNKFYRYAKPGVPTEYYLVENRQKAGRDTLLPGGGVAIWHIDELGSRDDQRMATNSLHRNYEVTLVQADNLWHFQNNQNTGDANDLYFNGNSAAVYVNRLCDLTAPHSHWWDGSDSRLNFKDFSTNGTTMTFTVEPPGSIGVNPLTGVTFAGLMGGPFTPSSCVYVVTNSLSSAVGWGVSSTQTWVSAAPSSGTLPGYGATNVTVSLNANANLLPAGTFSDLLSFTNSVDISTETRAVLLRISQAYYVNDASTTDDAWCTAAGSDANNGLTPATPKATVQAILDAYDLEPGDIVRIDTGSYDLTANITVTNQDSGSSAAPVTFEASPYGVTIDRKNTASGNYVWYINGGSNVTIGTAEGTNRVGVAQRWMKVTGGYYGVYLNSGDYSTLNRMDVYSNFWFGVRISTQYASLQNLLVRNITSSSSYPVYVGNSYASVSNCTVIQTNGLYGVYVGSSNCRLQNNIIYTDGAGRYALYASSLPSASDYNDLYVTNGAYAGYYLNDRRTIGDWKTATSRDTNSIGLNPLFVDVPGGDYHLKSTAGSYHAGAWTADAVDSPGLDSGNPASDYSKEPAPGGSRINMGAYGNTAQESKTPAARLLWFCSPAGGEVYPTQSVPVRVCWTWAGTAWVGTETLNLEYSANGGGTWSAIAGAGTVPVTNGYFAWNVSGLAPGPTYRVRLTCNEYASVTVQSAENFRMGTNLVFYVNDATTTDDAWCTATGSDANAGTTSNAPMLTVQSVLNAYNLEPGDTVRIDTGSYDLSSNITVVAEDSGSSSSPVTFEASPYGVTIDRKNTNANNYAWYVNGAAYVTIRTTEGTNRPGVPQRWMRISGAYHGVNLNSGNYATLQKLDVWSNNLYGVNVGVQYASLQNLLIRNTLSANGYAIYLNNTYGAVSNCTVVQTNGTWGIYVNAASCRLLNNTVYVDGNGRYAICASNLPSYSDYNDLYATNGACVGYSSSALTNLSNWKTATLKDTNSMSADPMFADLSGGDLHVNSIEGRYGPTGVWAGDARHSPCIDAGFPASPYANEPAPNGARVNIGAYGNTDQASMSATNTIWTIFFASPLGGTVPSAGYHSYYEGTVLSCSVTNSPIPAGTSTQKACIGWVMTGNIPASGTTSNCVVVLTNNASLTWDWRTNVQFACNAGPNGSVTGDLSGYYALGGNITVTSVPALYYRFGSWSGDVSPAQTNVNPLILTMDQTRAITVSFAANMTTNNTPHWWLGQYGLPTNDAGALYEDGDGQPAWQEYIAGTDPTNSASVLKFVDTSFVPGTNKFVLRWDSVAGRFYSIECATNLVSPGFGSITSGIPATPAMNVWTDTVPANSAQRYYRVSVSNGP